MYHTFMVFMMEIIQNTIYHFVTIVNTERFTVVFYIIDIYVILF